MKYGVHLVAASCLLVAPLFVQPLLAPAQLAAQEASPKSPREAFAALSALKLDSSAVFRVTPKARIELRRADVQLAFEEGTLAFYEPFEGRVSGVLFSGRGHILAAPRDAVEKQQIARFTGAPILDQPFISAYLRFTDDTAAELLSQLKKAEILPAPEPEFLAQTSSAVARLNSVHALRILSDRWMQPSRPYFFSGMDGLQNGLFDFVFDQTRKEQILFGQVRKNSELSYYDVWASYSAPGVPFHPISFQAPQYTIETSIQPDGTLLGTSEVRIHAESGGSQLLALQLARSLQVQSITTASGEPLVFFQNEGMSPQERETRGNDVVCVILPEALKPSQEITLRFKYQGNVIRDSGNGVFFVAARESWYPHLGDSADFSSYDLTMRWPRKLRLVATGIKVEEHDDGDFHVARWHSEKPASVAGFNLGEYAVSSLTSANRSIDVYANRQLEAAILERLRSTEMVPTPPVPGPFGTPSIIGRVDIPVMIAAPSPADALKQLSKEIDASIHFYETYSGPFPYKQLSVSQIPGTFGQGWPGLLYLSTYSFLPAYTQSRAGLSTKGQEHFTELVPFHEVAHQWWGNMVGWSDYRDQWIDESISNYLALMFADSQKTPERKLRIWLERYRDALVTKPPASDSEVADFGALSLGSRLTSSRSPEGFEQVTYPKGSWVIHMIRQMLRQPNTKDPDEKFVTLLRRLSEKYSYRALTTENLQHELESMMTPAMDIEGNRSLDWFFEDWIRGIGVPRYRVQFTTRRTEKGFLVKGTLYQTGVPRSFVAPVPLHSASGAFLARIIAGGPETSFHFTTAQDPGKIQIDPQLTLLHAVEH